jgi:hypothetical protein
MLLSRQWCRSFSKVYAAIRPTTSRSSCRSGQGSWSGLHVVAGLPHTTCRLVGFNCICTAAAPAAVVAALALDACFTTDAGLNVSALLLPLRWWRSQDRPSLRYIRDVLRMRSSDSITLRFQAVAELLQALEAAGMCSMHSMQSDKVASHWTQVAAAAVTCTCSHLRQQVWSKVQRHMSYATSSLQWWYILVPVVPPGYYSYSLMASRMCLLCGRC